MANELVSPVNNGQYTKTYASQQASKANETASTGKTEARQAKGDGYDQEMFLQLLVAEMQYQDPLEPTDNSQYLQQLASFTQIEAIQNVQASMDNIEGNSLVGNYVTLNVNGQEITGLVDFVKKDDEKGLLVNVNGEYYEKSKVTSVVDGDYYLATTIASAFTEAVDKLPKKDEVTVRDTEKVAEAYKYYNTLSSYPRAVDYIKDETFTKYNEVITQYEMLVAAQEAADKAKAEAEKTETNIPIEVEGETQEG